MGFMWIHFYWSIIAFHLAMVAAESNDTALRSQEVPEPPSVYGYAWSAWSSWSACSKTCGGGVSVQERECLPRSRTTVPEGTLPPPVIMVRVTRDVGEDCAGVDRRYHECNTNPCPGGKRNSRAEQCAAYDRRPFRGRFYTWVPYVDGDSPCTLNCRPLGQQFYASLSLVADGTPCTRPSARAICVHGTCQVVGRDSVLGLTDAREVRCGRRLVSGLFSRPRLPLGYSLVATVPRGACRLNVSEIMPSDNYIALKITNGSYIMNGEFAVSAPGTYDAAGTRFMYSRGAGLDAVFALGPTQYPIDIMILYTQPNPSIRYEYFTDPPPGDVEIESATRPNIPEVLSTAQAKHIRRHHTYDNFPRTTPASRYSDFGGTSREVSSAEDNIEENVIGGRRFLWKILSYTQCSRTCGGGIQVGKFKCIESSDSGDREVSPVHCSGSPPSGRRRRCGNVQCPPRWRAAAWSACPKCGPATKTRIVGCVQDHSRGITKVTDHKCPAPKPSTIKACNIPDCRYNTGEVKYIEAKRVSRPREQTDTFREGPVYTVTVNSSDLDVGPEYSFSATAGWLYTDWSECVGSCVGGGIQTRRVRCADPSGCAPRMPPDTERSCAVTKDCDPHDGQWYTGDWSPCSSSCGGKQVRGVVCVGGGGRRLRDAACRRARPERQQDCGGDCAPAWYYSEWGQCTGNCKLGTGVHRRTVWCAGAGGALADAACGETRPLAVRPCALSCATAASASAAPVTLPPELTIESQRSESAFEATTSTTTTSSTTQKATTQENETIDCEDKLSNCALAVQARLCHYNYYVQNCCSSCKGR